ncbi:uncharacterized protein LOC133182982 [Saccostrea echinata]|uniref:uncharacterized protein LOC133182982 n=1 Tax=Saccostrea echinata TaxID=191078 RepID=UPI002A817EFA|nr:uncharacterized protein LOC133182982 [Saccostrea echinata]
MAKGQKKEDGDEIRKALGLNKNQCLFCLKSEDNEEKFGKYIKKFGLTLHYFCMLFASGLSQRGENDEDGISGFLPADVLKELKRGLRLRCTFCKSKGATIGCVVGKCRTVFHYSCGIESKTLHQFFDTFSSFCSEHRPLQTACPEEQAEVSTCAICMTTVINRPQNDTLKSPCCRGSWFHRTCIQKHATTAGLYFFKCPLCNNKDHFQEEMLRMGVHIPDQDAAWETEPNAFTDLLERYLHCDAYRCHCDKGRDYNKDGGKWEILVCDWCGSTGSHVGCHNIIKVGPDDYMCPDCYEIEEKWNNCRGIKIKRKCKKKIPSPRANKRQEDPCLENKGKSEYQQQGSGYRKLTTPSALSDMMSGDEFSGPEAMDGMLSPGSCNKSAGNTGPLESPDKHESIISPISLSKCSGKKRFINKELQFNTQQKSSNVTSTMVTKKQTASKTVESEDEEIDVEGLEDRVEPQRKKSFPQAFSPPQMKGYAYVEDTQGQTREGRRMKRKKKQHDSIRKLLKLDIDMTWTDVDSSDSDSDFRPKKLRRRNSVKYTYDSSPSVDLETKKRKRHRASATVTSSSQLQQTSSMSENLVEMDFVTVAETNETKNTTCPPENHLVVTSLDNLSSTDESANKDLTRKETQKPKISLNQDLDVCFDEKLLSDNAPRKSSDSCNDRSVTSLLDGKLTLKRSSCEKSKSTKNRKASKGKKRYKMNPNQMLIKQWLENSNGEKKVEEKVELPPAVDSTKCEEKPRKTTLKIRFKGKTFLFNRRIRKSTSFKENLQAGEKESVGYSKQFSPRVESHQGKQLKECRNFGSNSWKSIDPLSSPPEGIADSTDLWREAKRMVFTERKKNFMEQRHLCSPRTFPKKKRSRAIESLVRLPDDTINSYDEERIYCTVSNLNVKCSLAKKFDFSERTPSESESTSTDMSTLTFIDTNSFLSESSMPKLSPVEMDDSVIIMRDKNRNDPQVSPVGDTHHCMLVNLKPNRLDIHKRAGSMSPNSTNHSETSLSDDDGGHMISSFPQRIATTRSMSAMDAQC